MIAMMVKMIKPKIAKILRLKRSMFGVNILALRNARQPLNNFLHSSALHICNHKEICGDHGIREQNSNAVFLVATLPHVKHRGSHWQRHARQPRQKEHAREKKSELAARCLQPHVHWRAASQTLQGSDLV